MSAESKAPSVPGLYFAASGAEFRWWDLVVEIGGEAPWLRIDAVWCRSSRKIERMEQVAKWGPRIEDPSPPKLEHPNR